MSAPRTKTSTILLRQLQTESDPIEKQKLQDQLWERLHEEGTPIIRKQENGKYQVIFVYKSADAKNVEVDCPDLYDRLLGKDGKPKQFEKIPKTDTFVLQLNDIPQDAFIPYSIIVNGNTNNPQTDAENRTSLPLYHYDLRTQKNLPKETSYIPLPEVKEPEWIKVEPPNQILGSFEKQEQFEDTTKSFVDRDVWVYKPKGFDDLKPCDKKIIFILDGESFGKTLTPYIDAMNNDQTNPLSNTAIVFIDSKTTKLNHTYGEFKYKPYPWQDSKKIDFIPERVYEFYFQRDDFSSLLIDRLIPAYTDKLAIKNKDNVILAAHSLAAYPVIEIASKSVNKIGGVILISPALNQRQSTGFPDKPNENLQSLPIYMQIGQLEDASTPKAQQEEQDMQSKSRLTANAEFYNKLKVHKFNAANLSIHASGHSEVHVIDGLTKGLQFIYSNRVEAQINDISKCSTSHINEELDSLPSAPSLQEQEQEKVKDQKQINPEETTLTPSPDNEMREKNDTPKKLAH